MSLIYSFVYPYWLAHSMECEVCRVGVAVPGAKCPVGRKLQEQLEAEFEVIDTEFSRTPYYAT